MVLVVNLRTKLNLFGFLIVRNHYQNLCFHFDFLICTINWHFVNHEFAIDSNFFDLHFIDLNLIYHPLSLTIIRRLYLSNHLFAILTSIVLLLVIDCSIIYLVLRFYLILLFLHLCLFNILHLLSVHYLGFLIVIIGLHLSMSLLIPNYSHLIFLQIPLSLYLLIPLLLFVLGLILVFLLKFPIQLLLVLLESPLKLPQPYFLLNHSLL